jgi:hypothetical protein
VGGQEVRASRALVRRADRRGRGDEVRGHRRDVAHPGPPWPWPIRFTLGSSGIAVIVST